MNYNNLKSTITESCKENNEHYSVISNTILNAILEAIPSQAASLLKIGPPPPLLTSSFSDWIKLIMLKYDLNQSEFSSKISFSQGDLSGILSNREARPIGLKKRKVLLKKIEEFLKNTNLKT